MIELKNDELVFRFPEVHEDAVNRVHFQRTLRIPDDNRSYNLPPGLGRFPMQHVDDFSESVPEQWREHGGVFLPMYQSEALWILFRGDYPMAIKVAAGKIDAVSGKPWQNRLTEDPQDYIVSDIQPWLDGFNVGEGLIRQFVAMPLGEGYTAEEQLSGKAQHGGIQLIAFPMKAEHWEKLKEARSFVACASVSAPVMDMGLAPGGLMKQEIYGDRYGIDVWDTKHSSRCFVHIANSLAWKSITGTVPPTEPPSAEQYTAQGLPWFDYYDADQKALKGAAKLAGLDSIAAKSIKKGEGPVAGNEPVKPRIVRQIRPKSRNQVREGRF